MAVNPVSLMESLRPWREAGLLYILCESNAANNVEENLEPSFLSYDGSKTELNPAVSDSSGQPSVKSQLQTATAGQQSRQNARSQTEKTENKPPHSTADKLPPSSRLQPENLPEHWSALLTKTKAAPILWSYPSLGLDLSGQGSKERSDCLKKIINSLNLPKGSSTFWPLRMSQDDAAGVESAATCFQTGLALLRSKIIIFFGESSIALSGLSLYLSIPFTQRIFDGNLYLLLPDFEQLFEKTALMERTTVFLRTAFSSFPLLFSH